MSATELEVRVEVVGRELPGLRFADTHGPRVYEPVHVGIQEGREVRAWVPADAPEVRFEARFRVRDRDGAPNFLGPFSQGPVDDRFFYLNWAERTPFGTFAGFRRLKVRLGHLTWPQVEAAAREDRPLRVELRLTDAKGGPLCATPPADHVRWTP